MNWVIRFSAVMSGISVGSIISAGLLVDGWWLAAWHQIFPVAVALVAVSLVAIWIYGLVEVAVGWDSDR